jgi:A/G-specific adenine glycosylase
MTRTTTAALAPALLAWHEREGRHDLPWQRDGTPYRVWISEIMLQQTQVATVIPYYLRFLRRFPDIRTLAAAPLDEVLHLWSGLGYYARARNLHRAAARVMAEHAGQFPTNFAAVAALPGIGRSTAGAILALTRGERFPILDGNARRVIARYFGVSGATLDRSRPQRLWELAEHCMPHERIAAYTQAIMDLGATVCLRRKPLCVRCPLAARCFARRTGRQHEFPALRRAPLRGRRHAFMVVALTTSGEVLLERRPESGIWGGLWCLPEFSTTTAAAAFVRNSLSTSESPRPLPALEHAFTHFDLRITPLLIRCAPTHTVMEGGRSLWYNIREPAAVGLPAPVTALFSHLAEETLFGAGHDLTVAAQ